MQVLVPVKAVARKERINPPIPILIKVETKINPSLFEIKLSQCLKFSI